MSIESSERLRFDRFVEEDREVAEKLVSELLPYLDSENTMLVGGVAIGHHAAVNGTPSAERALNDLDVIARVEASISPAVTERFLVSHHHRDGNTFYLQLVEARLKATVDVFGGAEALWPDDPITVTWRDQSIQICDVESQLAKTVIDISRISEDKKVDPKQFEDATVLERLADTGEAERYWRERRGSEGPSLAEAFQKAFKIAKEHPDWIKSNPFQKPAGYVCPDCIDTPEFPLTELDEINRVLGRT